ncbi:hypothetical protein AVMA1855_16785 [Acidovorax sp. SUPP1855]|uniref:hypothetical protein n=1 Tax=Acidovorax sp. SUPP1855 TaxID=431774 RepID=UPI0023DE4534|nr:hypothetical protein [Acidovorax sp. SUPP1855]GKS85831.1 hypothetical protein AVMA1855_16785 [Acidovorax sp. SUPP1855]
MNKTDLPNLAGVATSDLVENIGTGKFSASYINWSRTMHMLREHAPGWLPELMVAPDGYVLHQAPVGAYLMIRFRNGDVVTPPVPQAIMDTRNAAIPIERITARDITDTHRRGVCMAAALTFGLAYELWAKLPMESGYAEQERQTPAPKHRPMPADALSALPEDVQQSIRDLADEVTAHVLDKQPASAVKAIHDKALDSEQKVALWSLLNPATRSAIKTAEKAPHLQTA